MKKFARSIATVLENSDVYVFGGMLAIGVGLWQLSPALGITVPGTLLFALGLWMSLPRNPTNGGE